ncbi:MAG: hypothetical protein NVS9B2_23940 [Steroidobacteraceae bacterium]
MLDPAFGFLIIGGFTLLFVTASAQKLSGLARFIEIFAAYRVLPEAPARRLAWLVPCLELVIAAALGWKPSRRMAALCGIAVLIAYASGLAINLRRGRIDLDCGCGAARGRRTIAAWMVWRNLFLAAALAIAALPWSPRQLDVGDFPTVLGGIIAVVILYAAVDRLLGDVAPRALPQRGTS